MGKGVHANELNSSKSKVMCAKKTDGKSKERQFRGDITIGNLEKKLGLEPGSIRNPDGSDARSDKKLKTLRKEYATTISKRQGSGKPKK